MAKYFVLKGEHFDNSKAFEKSEILCLHKPVNTQQGSYFTEYFETEEQRKNRINELIKFGYKEVVRL